MHLSLLPHYVDEVYQVRCLRCDYSAESETLGRVFRLEEEHKAEAGGGHLLDWETVDGSAVRRQEEADEVGDA